MSDIGDRESGSMTPFFSKEANKVGEVWVEVDPKFDHFRSVISSCLEAIPDSVLDSGKLKKIAIGTEAANRANSESAAYWDEADAPGRKIDGLEAGTITVPNKYLDITKTEKHKIGLGLVDRLEGNLLTLEELPSIIMHEIGHAAYFYLRDNHSDLIIQLLKSRERLLKIQSEYVEKEMQGRRHLSFEESMLALNTEKLPFIYYGPNARLIGNRQRLFYSKTSRGGQTSEGDEFIAEMFCDYILEREQIIEFAKILPGDQQDIYLGENGIVAVLDRVPSFLVPRQAQLKKIQSDLNMARAMVKNLLVSRIILDPENALLRKRYEKEFGVEFDLDQRAISSLMAPSSDSTSIKYKFLGKEIPISKPLYLPEIVKNYISGRLLTQYQKALPGVDFSVVRSEDLKKLGLQFIINYKPSREQVEVVNKLPFSFLEALTQIVSTYVENADNEKPQPISELRASTGLYSDEVSGVGEAILDAISSMYESDPAGAMSLLARSLFTGDLTALRELHEAGHKLFTFDQLLKSPSIKNPAEVSRCQSLLNLFLAAGGIYGRGEREIVLNIGGFILVKTISSLASDFYDTADSIDSLIERLGKEKIFDTASFPPTTKKARRLSKNFQLLKSTMYHEFAHFITYLNWERVGFATDLPRKFTSERALEK